MRIARFTVEWGGGFGWGHLVRCSALAHALNAAGWRCGLASSSSLDGLPADVRAPWAPVQAGQDPDLEVFDYPFHEVLRSWPVCVLDDLGVCVYSSARWVVNPSPALRAAHYRPSDRSILGEQFAPLRPGFRPQSSRASGRRVFILAGGGNPLLSDHIVRHLAALDPAWQPIIASTWTAAEIVAAAHTCAFAITSGGLGSMLEIAALHIPFIAVRIAENQRISTRSARAAWSIPVIDLAMLSLANLSAAIDQLDGVSFAQYPVNPFGAAEITAQLHAGLCERI